MRALAASLATAVLGVSVAAPSASGETYHARPELSRQAIDVIVHPGDRLTLTADGCLQIPGQPPRPLLQEDPNVEQGLIFIPGVTMRFVPIAELVGRDLFIPRELDFPDPARIWLDWGRSYRSPLQTEHAPRGPRACDAPNRPPTLDIHVESDAPPPHPPVETLTLELTRYDRNLLPLNPTWAGGVQPDLCAACDGFRVERRAHKAPWVPSLESPRCTRQRPYIDAGGCRPHSGDCPGKGPRLEGHVNWGPATFTGLLSTSFGRPVYISLDGDVNFYLEPDGGAGLLAQNPKSRYRGVIGLEFASAETVRWFRSPWWRLLPFRHWSYKPIQSLWSARNRHPGVSGKFPLLRHRPATVIGIFGIDTAHRAHPEIHPVQAIAIQTESNGDRDVFQVFARNWGTGGDCAGRLDARLTTHRIALLLPGAAGRNYDSADGAFSDHGIEVANWMVYTGENAPTLVLELPADRPCSVVEGQLVLRHATGSASASDSHLTAESAPVGEPIRLDLVPGKDQLCVQEPWFLPVP